ALEGQRSRGHGKKTTTEINDVEAATFRYGTLRRTIRNARTPLTDRSKALTFLTSFSTFLDFGSAHVLFDELIQRVPNCIVSPPSSSVTTATAPGHVVSPASLFHSDKASVKSKEMLHVKSSLGFSVPRKPQVKDSTLENKKDEA
ncbi:hypothetical protein HID58_066588, partial [Brassica napus]